MMSLFPAHHIHHDDQRGATGAGRWLFARALARVATAFKIIHRAIVAAKLRRLRSELMCHGGYVYGQPSDQDAGKIPQPPLILGDKWDF